MKKVYSKQDLYDLTERIMYGVIYTLMPLGAIAAMIIFGQYKLFLIALGVCLAVMLFLVVLGFCAGYVAKFILNRRMK